MGVEYKCPSCHAIDEIDFLPHLTNMASDNNKVSCENCNASMQLHEQNKELLRIGRTIKGFQRIT